MFLAIRELKHSKLRYLLIGLIIVLVALLVFIISGLANGLSSDNASSIQNMKADYFVMEHDSKNKLNRSIISMDMLEELREPEVQTAEGLGQMMATLNKIGSNEKTEVTIFATNGRGILAPEVMEGTSYDDKKQGEAVADRSLKEVGYKLGDSFQDELSGKVFTIVGFTENQSYSHAPVVYMNVAGWREINPVLKNHAKNSISALAVQMDAKDEETIREALPDGVTLLSKDEMLQSIPGFKEEQATLTMMIAFLFVIAAFVLAVFFYVITLQKTNQFGVLKALGANTVYLAKSIVGQVMLLAVVCIVISVALTYGVTLIMPEGMPFELRPDLVIKYSLLLLVVSALGSILSLYRVAKIDALDAIGRVS
ncbi:ABC transporter permease [Peribacillus muralis]|uniref:Putative hemin transport system permease protein HrtB n=1 Tax=Peribacillus muralis TaxID=264697 RepID=A0A1B3XIV1_9BACI|nr:ABC transporter permease [Peribacillus muralis]AOH53148.1 ABC transporter permease [Peribacillus muralis]